MMTVHQLRGGEMLFRQGHVGLHFFVLLHGAALVWIKQAPNDKASAATVKEVRRDECTGRLRSRARCVAGG